MLVNYFTRSTIGTVKKDVWMLFHKLGYFFTRHVFFRGGGNWKLLFVIIEIWIEMNWEKIKFEKKGKSFFRGKMIILMENIN